MAGQKYSACSVAYRAAQGWLTLLRHAADLASSTAWQPRGILVAHLAEHRRAINRIAVAQSVAFFVTASDDETCKIWDSRRLEKDISFRSKLTYASQVHHHSIRTLCKANSAVLALAGVTQHIYNRHLNAPMAHVWLACFPRAE